MYFLYIKTGTTFLVILLMTYFVKVEYTFQSSKEAITFVTCRDNSKELWFEYNILLCIAIKSGGYYYEFLYSIAKAVEINGVFEHELELTSI